MEYSKEKEFQLINDILNGDRNQYRVLVDRYAPVVFSIVRRFVNREADVEELAQQIFVKAYERLESFNKNARFSSWLYRLAKNHCLDFAKNIRQSNRQFSEMDEHEVNSALGEQEAADEFVLNKEWNSLLEEALQQINPDYAEAFLYKYRDDMTYRAMSRRLGIGVSALKVRVHRARKELKEYLEKQN